MVDLHASDILDHADVDTDQADVTGRDSTRGRRRTEMADLLARRHGVDSRVVMVPVAQLRPSDSPRFGGLDPEHARTLADVEGELPPILVRRSTMRVIDGMHRLTAAELRGQETIAVRFFEGDEEAAFLLAVHTNIAHGLPLKVAERRRAAERIVRAHPQMSDRAIAEIAGLAAKTVAAVRRGATDDLPQLDARVGLDGRTRPLSTAEGRRIAGDLFALLPDASLRKVAKGAGISVGTARDVRERIRRGDDPAPPRQRPRAETVHTPSAGVAGVQRPVDVVDAGAALDSLRRDPSIAYSPAGRSMLRWLATRLLSSSDWKPMLEGIPPHCAIVVARIARQTSTSWKELAEALERQASDCA
jgi:ParB-like chromosome segregation protein Spo0J